MRVLVALGGNALLERGQPLTVAQQRANVRRAACAIAPLAAEHAVVLSHGNGPQVGLLALQAEAFDRRSAYPLDVLGAETEGMIGYLIVQELGPRLPPGMRCAALLTQVVVDAADPAFARPTKPIGPVYDEGPAAALARERGWAIHADGAKYRRVVPSPRPIEIVEREVIELLLREQVVVICAGGGGIPVVRRADGRFDGVEAVVDKDLSSALLARELGCDVLLLLTDVECVFDGWGGRAPRGLRRVTPAALRGMTFEPGSMGPKVEAACEFVEGGSGCAAIGALGDAGRLLDGAAGTRIAAGAASIAWWD